MCRSACPAALARPSIYAAKRFSCGPGAERREPIKQFYIKLLFCNTVDRKSTRLNSSHRCISYAVFCLKKKKKIQNINTYIQQYILFIYNTIDRTVLCTHY